MTSTFLTFVILMLANPGCRRDVFRDLKRGNYQLVVVGSYDGTADYIGAGAGIEKTVADYRRRLEARPDILSAIARHDFPGATALRFEFKMALWDRPRDHLILRYYAPQSHGPYYAGYQLFFVCEIKRRNLVRIYSSEVPLE